MNYFDYLCGVYEICFRTPAKLNAADKQSTASREDHQQPKFYDYSEKPINESFIGAATLNLFASAASNPIASKETKSITLHKNSDLDVIPKSCGDWVMRYSENETNFNPWQFNTKFSHFELVPWRQHSNKRIDLMNTAGWEPFQLTPTNEQLRTLQKFELARTKRLQKLRSKSLKNRFRRQIKIRIIFSLELRQKKMKLFRTPNASGKLLAADPHKQKLVLQRDQQLFVFDKDMFDLAEHWAYFSQRNKGVEEILVSNASQLDLRHTQKCITNSPISTLSKEHSSSRDTVGVQQSTIRRLSTVKICEKCQNRCVCF